LKLTIPVSTAGIFAAQQTQRNRSVGTGISGSYDFETGKLEILHPLFVVTFADFKSGAYRRTNRLVCAQEIGKKGVG
jgi:hypothetical protein